jgi:outer membrane lipoprotein SlyB
MVMIRTILMRGRVALALVLASLLVACTTAPTYSVSQPYARDGVVEAIRSQTVQKADSTVGTIVGALAGGALGNMVGGGTGRTVATVVGAVGGGFAGHEIAKNAQDLVWIIDVRYDDGTMAQIQQKAAPGLRVGDRVRVTQNGIELLR